MAMVFVSYTDVEALEVKDNRLYQHTRNGKIFKTYFDSEEDAMERAIDIQEQIEAYNTFMYEPTIVETSE